MDLTVELALGAVAAIAGVASAWVGYRTYRSSKKAPVVRARQLLPPPYWLPTAGSRFMVYVTNEGPGKAYNVRYGVLVDGVEYPSGGGRGSRIHLDAGSSSGAVAIDVLAYKGWPGQEAVRAGAVFFARYEDEEGSVWETLNPVDLEANMKRRGVLLPSLRARIREMRRRRRRRAEIDWRRHRAAGRRTPHS